MDTRIPVGTGAVNQGEDYRLQTAGTVALVMLVLAAVLTDWIQNYTAVYAIEAAALAMLAWFAVMGCVRRRSVRWSGLIVPIAAAACWPLAQLALGTTIYTHATLREALFGMAWFAVFFVALQCFGDPGARERMRRWVVGGGCALAVLATVQMFTSGGKVFWIFPTGYKDFVMGPFLNRDHYSAVIELVLPVAVYQAFVERRDGWKWAVMAAAMTASVVAGASRAGFLVIAAELAVCAAPAWIGRGAERGRTWQATGQILVVSVAFAAVVGWDVLWNRFQEEELWRDRWMMTRSAVAMARERPWTGFGLGTFEFAYPAYALFDRGTLVNHAHNDWAEWAAEGGLGYLAAMVAIVAGSLYVARRARWAVGIPAVFAHSLVDYNLHTQPVALCLFLLLGAACARGQGGQRELWAAAAASAAAAPKFT
jgi:hypothetical protein